MVESNMNISDKGHPQECPKHLQIWVWGAFAYRKFETTNAVVVTKGRAHLWSYRGRAYNVWRCAIPIGVVGSPCVCHIVVPCMGCRLPTPQN